MFIEIYYWICFICEVGCGLFVIIDGGEVKQVWVNLDDIFFEGYICLKGVFFKELYDDFDCLRMFFIKWNGKYELVFWEEVFLEIDKCLFFILKDYGFFLLVIYIGNLIVYNFELGLGFGFLGMVL